MLANRAIERTPELARGLSPVDLGSDGLVAALHAVLNLCLTSAAAIQERP